MTYLLGTNHIIHLCNGVRSVVDRLDAVPDTDRVVTSELVYAELMYGARR